MEETPRIYDRKLNILVMPVGRDGCSGYRITKPYQALKKLGHDVIFISNSVETSGEELIRLALGADVLVFRPNHYQLMMLLKKVPEIKAKFVVDIDDDQDNMSPFADAYRKFGTKEVKWNGEWLWKDGESGFDLKKNKRMYKDTIEMLIEADAISVTTPYLAKRATQMSGNTNTMIVNNAIDFNHWQKWDFKENEKIRIGWTGGSTHYIDWYEIKDALKRVFDKYDNIELVIQGCKWDGTLQGVEHEFYEWVDFDAHPYKTASLDLDIAIIPLKDTLFNKCKSNIKWYEFSALGIPSVVSGVLPYTYDVKDNKNALVYKTIEEFEEKLGKLIENKELRKRIGDAAYDYVKKNNDLVLEAKKHERLLLDLVNKKDE